MRRLAVMFGLVSALVVVPAGAAHGGGGGCHGGRTEVAGTTVDMAGNCFQQTVLHVSSGQTVTWTNRESVQHTVTGVGGEWGSYEPVDFGATLTNAFDDAGVYPYFCLLHPGMVGAVVVDGGSGAGRVAAAVPVSAVIDEGSAGLAWWISGGLLSLLVVAGGIYLLERVRSTLPRG